MICLACRESIDNAEERLLRHQVVYHAIDIRPGFDNWGDVLKNQRAMDRFLQTYYQDGDDGTSGVREPRRPNPPLPVLSTFADSDSE